MYQFFLPVGVEQPTVFVIAERFAFGDKEEYCLQRVTCSGCSDPAVVVVNKHPDKLFLYAAKVCHPVLRKIEFSGPCRSLHYSSGGNDRRCAADYGAPVVTPVVF